MTLTINDRCANCNTLAIGMTRADDIELVEVTLTDGPVVGTYRVCQMCAVSLTDPFAFRDDDGGTVMVELPFANSDLSAFRITSYDGRYGMQEDNGQFREQEEDQYARYLDTFR